MANVELRAYFFSLAPTRETEDDSGVEGTGVVASSRNTPASVSRAVARVVIVVLFSLMFVLLNWPPGRDLIPAPARPYYSYITYLVLVLGPTWAGRLVKSRLVVVVSVRVVALRGVVIFPLVKR